ncbi:CHRD domain-containing protein [Prosthecobacter debontii]|uniref:CHRD domain-containing protein n=1 Tax=Prosthecobacter debontii TaxID=48467 RepID=A0A1T4WI66_9BACT|nr:DUF1800 family protein [Prosthecobacter debontii]SKA77036.1 CHRD domain-containing protein [Prosthecobacter debontii]
MQRSHPWTQVKAFAVSLALLASSSALLADTDYDEDGFSDVWQQIYTAWGLAPNGDEDNDGCTNYLESIAGTNPWDPLDCVKVDEATVLENEVVIRMASKPGKFYRLLSSASPGGPGWTSEGEELTGTGEILEFITPQSGGSSRRFFRVETYDKDSDGDGVEDWAEAMTGTDPAESNTLTNASGGSKSDGEVLKSLFALSFAAVESDSEAIEKEGQTARIRLSRPAEVSATALTVDFSLSDNPDPAKGSASGNDFTLSVTQPGGAVVGTGSGQVTIPAGVSTMDIIVNATADSAAEVPELLTMHLQRPGEGFANVPLAATAMIKDADPVNEANRTLFVAYLGKEAGVNTNATGIATALVNGDNDGAEISLMFSNLTSAQNTAYLRIENDDIINVGLGQVSGREWAIRAASIKLTDQAMLNALYAGQLYISITTADNPTGEIRGYFNRATGSTDFTYNPNLHGAPTLGSSNWLAPTPAELERDIWRFLDQCTFGGTESLYQEVLAEVNTALGNGGTYLDGYSAWLDKQIALPNPSLLELTYAADNEEFVLRGNKPLWSGNDPQFAGESYGVTFDSFYGTPTISATSNGTFNNNHPFHNNRRREQWTLAMQAKAQVRQRMAHALSQIVVISEIDGTVQSKHYGAAAYWDMLADNAFGPYRSILEKVTYSPMMGIYLSHLRNRAEYVSGGVSIFPDENYAREIMQLFSIGLVLRHPDGSLVLGPNGLPIATYDNSDITELARVMTGLCHGARHATASVQRFNGLHFAASSPRVGTTIEIQGVDFTGFNEGGGDSWWQAPWIYPMKALGRTGTVTSVNRPMHDFAAKTLLHNYNGGTAIPGLTDSEVNALSLAQSNQRADQDIAIAHNLLAGDPTSQTYNGHQNTPVNISRWLIQRFTTSNPSAGYLYRVSQVYRNTNGNLGSVLKSILLDYEARSLQLADTSISHGRIKEPLVHFMAVMRGLKAYTGLPVQALRDMQLPFSATDSPKNTPLSSTEFDKYLPNATRFRFSDSTTALGQSPLRAPSVFNWYLPDYMVPGPMAAAGVFAPELQIASETNLVNRINRLWTYTWMNLVGMAVQPGSDSGVEDVTQVSTNAAVQVKVGLNQSNANSFATTQTLTFTSTNYNTPQTIYVAAVDDNIREGTHVTSIQHMATSADASYNNAALPAQSISITDNEGTTGAVIVEQSDDLTVVSEHTTPATYSDTYTVKLSSAPTANVTVTANANAQLALSPASLTFSTSNWNTPQTVTVTAVNDAFSSEVIHMGFVGHSVASTDAAYAGVAAPSLTAFVGDNDQAGSNGITVRHTDATTVVKEGGGTDRIVVALNRAPTANVTVSLGTNARITRSPASLTFTTSNWWVPQVVTIQAVDDALANGDTTFNLSLSSSGGGYSSTATAAITVLDNDSTAAGSIVITQTGGTTQVAESATFSTGTQDSYTVRLSSQPLSNVTVVVSPIKHVRPMSSYAKQMGYYASDSPASTSNNQKDRVVFDYTDIITLYNSTFTSSGGVTGSNANNLNAHLAATQAVINKMDLMWCGGQLKSQWPATLTTTDLADTGLINPRKSIVAGVLYGYSTSRGSSESSYAAEVRDRCRIAAYLVSISPQSFTLK